MKGFVHSIQSLGTVDGPGVRFVVFLSGCHLRCHCCHNPDTWQKNVGKEYTPEEILSRVLRFREYFGKDGGITVSGGEPLLQAAFVKELFTLCREQGINTCLDTSGSILNETVKELLFVTDRVLLDMKYTDNEQYLQYVGCSLDAPMAFLTYLNAQKIKTTLRQVIIPQCNDNAENIKKLKQIGREHSCVEKIELLPFRKICQVKYDEMGIQFPFSHLPEPTAEQMAKLNQLLK